MRRTATLTLLLAAILVPAFAAEEQEKEKKVNRRVADALERIADAQEKPQPIVVECVALDECEPETCESLGCATEPDLDALCPAAGWVRPCPEGTSCQAPCEDCENPDPPPALPDWNAWWSVLNNTSRVGVQVARPGERQPPYEGAQWAVEDSSRDPIGLGDTIREAFEDYRRKGGRQFNDGTAPPPTARQQRALEKFLTLRRMPTSIRRTGTGFYVCDYFRSRDLHDATALHPTPEEAIEELEQILGDEW